LHITVLNPANLTQTTVGPTINTYDSFGRRNSVTWPVRWSVPIGYDAVDSPSGDLNLSNTPNNSPVALQYSYRKEWIGGQPYAVNYSVNGSLMALDIGGVEQYLDVLDGNMLGMVSGVNNPGNPLSPDSPDALANPALAGSDFAIIDMYYCAYHVRRK